MAIYQLMNIDNGLIVGMIAANNIVPQENGTTFLMQGTSIEAVVPAQGVLIRLKEGEV